MPATPAEIARRALADHLAALPAGQLLSRYAASRDPEAFAALVHQFGPLVLATCRRVLGHSPDADDAFQAVFLALARQAGSFRDAAALPAWLHRVSLRVARKALARRTSGRLRGQTPPGEPGSPEPADPADPFADVAWRDVRRVLDEEIDALAEKYRGPVVLCWLDGLTQDEAAGRLGVSLNTLKRRLAAGRELLRSRLARRGLVPVLVTAVVATPTGLRAVVPESLRLLAVEFGVGGDVPAGVGALVVNVPAPGPGYWKVVLAAVLVGGVATAGVVGVNAVRPKPPVPEPGEPPPLLVQLDEPDEPLPSGAVARFGNARFRVPGRISTNSPRVTALSPDGRLIAVGVTGPPPPGSLLPRGSLSVYETATWKLVQRAAIDGIPHGPVYFSPDGTRVTYRIEWPAGVALGDPRFEAARWAALHVLDVGTGESRRCSFFTDVNPRGFLGLTAEGLFMKAGKGCVEADSGKVLRPLPSGVWDGNPNRPGVTATAAADFRQGPPGGGPPPRVQPTEDERRNLGPFPSPDGTLVAEVTHEGSAVTVTVWRADPWEQIAKFRSPADYSVGHYRTLLSASAWIAEDNRSLALTLPGGDVARWELPGGRELPRLRMPKLVPGEQVGRDWPDHVDLNPLFAIGDGLCGYHVLPGGRHILTPRADGIFLVWDAATGEELPVPGRYLGAVKVRPSGDGRYVLVADTIGRVDLLDAVSGRVVRTLRRSDGEEVLSVAINHTGTVVAIDTTPAGRGVVTRSYLNTADGTKVPEEQALGGEWPAWFPRSARLLDIPLRLSWQDLTGGPFRVTIDGNSVPGELTITDTGSGRVRKVIPDIRAAADEKPGPEGGVGNWCVSRDGALLLGEAFGSVAIWDAVTGRLVARVPHAGGPPRGVVHAWFTPDGKSVITFGGVPADGGAFGYRWDIEKLIAAQKK